MGAQRSRNVGIQESGGAFLAFVDDDDEWMPQKLERQAALLANAPDRVGLVYAWADTVKQDGTPGHPYRSAQRGDVLKTLLDVCFIPSPTVVVRRTALEESGGFDESLPSCQDWDMWTRVVQAGYGIDVVEEVLARHHKHGRASIGTSPSSLDGFMRYYAKHAHLYRQEGMARNLSEKYRGLADEAARAGDRTLTQAALRLSLEYWNGNWKAMVRYAQFLLRVERY
jgi:glycosyltransferase involved in cell wall biosynthesis